MTNNKKFRNVLNIIIVMRGLKEWMMMMRHYIVIVRKVGRK